MLQRFLAWWGQNLLALLPAAFLRLWRSQDAVVATVTAAGVALLLRRRGKEAQLGVFGPGQRARVSRRILSGRHGPVVLGLPPGTLLQRRVELPIAAARDLAQVLHYELDRLTPFNPDELHWTWHLRGQDRTRGRVIVDLLLVPRQAVASMLETAREAGVVPTALEAPDGRQQVPLAPENPRQARLRRRALAFGSAVCGVLAVAAVAVPFVRQSLAARQIERRIVALQPQMNRLDALRRRIAGGAAGANVVAAQRAETGDPLAVLALVTDVLPDDTYLRELTLRGRVLSLAGQSAAAARLIPALSATAELRDPAFTAPLTRNDTARADLFSIRATVAP